MLQNQLPSHYVLVTPFHAIMLRLGEVGLCPPGTGTKKYGEMAKALFTCLRHDIIPRQATHLQSVARMIGSSNGDGYALLWNILMLTMPAFDRTVRPQFPLWEDCQHCVHQFADACMLYFVLQSKRGERHDHRDKSLQYLRAITEPGYQTIVIGLITAVISDVSEELSDAFQIHNLALRIFTDMGNFELPTQRRVNHMTLTPSVDFAEEDVISPEYHMQDGSVLDMTDPMIKNLRREDTRGARPPRREPAAGRGHSRSGDRAGRGDKPYRRQPLDPQMTCEACGADGHGARQCRGLGRTLRLFKFMGSNKRLCDEVMADWKTKKRSGGERMVVRYMQAAKLSLDDIYQEMDWEFIDSLDQAEAHKLCLPVD